MQLSLTRSALCVDGARSDIRAIGAAVRRFGVEWAKCDEPAGDYGGWACPTRGKAPWSRASFQRQGANSAMRESGCVGIRSMMSLR